MDNVWMVYGLGRVVVPFGLLFSGIKRDIDPKRATYHSDEFCKT